MSDRQTVAGAYAKIDKHEDECAIRYSHIAIAAHRIAEHYRDAESEGIYLVPFHLAVDPVAGFDGDSDPIHPNATGYEQMGDQLYFALNALTVVGAL